MIIPQFRPERLVFTPEFANWLSETYGADWEDRYIIDMKVGAEGKVAIVVTKREEPSDG
jgi:hypothetical protein